MNVIKSDKTKVTLEEMERLKYERNGECSVCSLILGDPRSMFHSACHHFCLRFLCRFHLQYLDKSTFCSLLFFLKLHPRHNASECPNTKLGDQKYLFFCVLGGMPMP